MKPPFRVTTAVTLLLDEMMRSPAEEVYGLDLARRTGLKSGSLYPILGRLEDHGWLVSRWEDMTNGDEEGRPRRRYYRLSGQGIDGSRAVLDQTPMGLALRLGLKAAH